MSLTPPMIHVDGRRPVKGHVDGGWGQGNATMVGIKQGTAPTAICERDGHLAIG
jgi:hypothetical protein